MRLKCFEDQTRFSSLHFEFSDMFFEDFATEYNTLLLLFRVILLKVAIRQFYIGTVWSEGLHDMLVLGGPYFYQASPNFGLLPRKHCIGSSTSTVENTLAGILRA